ncbi:hypothetical protein [Profundibacter sp.]
MLRVIFLWAIGFLLAVPLNAKENPSDTSLVQMNTRTFDLRTDISGLRRDDDFIPLTDIEWLHKLIKSDPLLLTTIVHIQVRPDPIRTFWPSLESDREFPLTENIPGSFIIDGFQTRSAHPTNRSLRLLPIADPNDFFVNCSGPDLEKQALLCVVYASYPPDPNIRLMARIYYPKPPYHFREIAHRIREIAYCLDVTDRLDKDGRSPEKPVDPDGELPILEDCYVEPTS